MRGEKNMIIKPALQRPSELVFISHYIWIYYFSETQSGSEKEPHNLLTIGLFIKIYVRLSSKLVYL